MNRPDPCVPLTCLLLASLLAAVTCGCRRGAESTVADAPATPAVSPEVDSAPEAPVEITPRLYEVSAEQLLAARMGQQQASEGWIRLLIMSNERDASCLSRVFFLK